MPDITLLALTALVSVLSGFGLGMAYGSRRARAGQQAASSPQYVCACGEGLLDPADARQHAILEHGAHPDAPEMWRGLVEPVE